MREEGIIMVQKNGKEDSKQLHWGKKEKKKREFFEMQLCAKTSCDGVNYVIAICTLQLKLC